MAKARIQQVRLPFPPEKLCRKCKQILPTSAFRADSRFKDGLFTWCRKCHSAHKTEGRPRHEPHLFIDGVERKKCLRCRRVLKLDCFTKVRLRWDGLESQCRECKSAKHKKRYSNPSHRAKLIRKTSAYKQTPAGKETLYRRRLNLQYGMTRQQYEAMVQAQNGLCAICGQPPNGRRLSVDHNHETGAIRALICNSHNTAIGLLNEDLDLIAKVAEYLQKHR